MARDPAHRALGAWLEVDAALEPLGAGHINDTWLVRHRGRGYVLQRISDAVFPDPVGVAKQVAEVVAYLEAGHGRSSGIAVPPLMAGRSGERWHRDESGVWRLWRQVTPARTLEPLRTVAQAESAGRAFGAFQAATADLDLSDRPDPIPGFLQLGEYLKVLDRMLDAADGMDGPAAEDAVAFIDARRDLAGELSGRDRTIHGDCKVDNLLFHPRRDEVVAVIDLDTVMHGNWAWDFGDLVRSAAVSPRGGIDVDLFAALVRGFVPAAGVAAGSDDLVLAPRYVALMLGVRFLTDHLAGDRYFKVSVRGENLARARRQLALAADMEAREADLRIAVRRR